jgi:hypothetical protein
VSVVSGSFCSGLLTGPCSRVVLLSTFRHSMKWVAIIHRSHERSHKKQVIFGIISGEFYGLTSESESIPAISHNSEVLAPVIDLAA